MPKETHDGIGGAFSGLLASGHGPTNGGLGASGAFANLLNGDSQGANRASPNSLFGGNFGALTPTGLSFGGLQLPSPNASGHLNVDMARDRPALAGRARARRRRGRGFARKQPGRRRRRRRGGAGDAKRRRRRRVAAGRGCWRQDARAGGVRRARDGGGGGGDEAGLCPGFELRRRSAAERRPESVPLIFRSRSRRTR